MDISEILASEQVIGVASMVIALFVAWASRTISKKFSKDSVMADVMERIPGAVQETFDKLVKPAKVSGDWSPENKEAARVMAKNIVTRDLPKAGLKLISRLGESWLQNQINRTVQQSKK